ncbi:hypothetical protein ACIGJO_30450 [Streptomyces sp. NPDC079020]|uniref:hypothetical protein n=1 Tax=Streptomyces sp. NPDC079020 TaxID=3365722 RepID=UPI0037CDC350
MSADDAATTPGSNYEFNCGEFHLKAQNVPERVQLLFLMVVGALSISALALARNSRCDSGEDS